MRKLKVSSFLSLDGVTENPQHISAGFFDEEARKHAFDLLDGVDTFLAGRPSHEMFTRMWSSMAGNPYVDKLISMTKIVASSGGPDLASTLAALKAQPGGTILKYGVTSLDRMLLENGLVDEYHLWIFPRVVGSGRRAFEGVDPALVKLALTQTRRFASGVIVLSYATSTSQGASK